MKSNTLTRSTLQSTDYFFSSDIGLSKKNLPANLTHTQSYYRPLTFETKTSINSLIAAAAPLLTLNARLKSTSNYQNIQDLYQHLVHEIKVFETNAKKHHYRSETILIARYILCCTLDETISKTNWAQEKGWQEQQLLKNFQGEEQPEERFFIILDKLMQDTPHHLDLLELFYLLLSQGFEGKYGEEPQSKFILDTISDNLYHQIKDHRNELKCFLLAKEKINVTPKVKPNKIGLKIPVFLSLISLFSTFATLDTYFFSDSKPVVNGLITINGILKNHG